MDTSTKAQIKALHTGEKASFEAHKVTFIVKKHNGQGGVYSLDASNVHTRNRWGTLTEILDDLDHCLTYGTLPRPSGSHW